MVGAGSAVVVFINTGKIMPKSQAEVQFLKEEESVSRALSLPPSLLSRHPPRISLASVESARQSWCDLQSPFLDTQLYYPTSQADFRVGKSAEFFYLETSNVCDVRPPKGVQSSLHHARGGIIIIQRAHREDDQLASFQPFNITLGFTHRRPCVQDPN